MKRTLVSKALVTVCVTGAVLSATAPASAAVRQDGLVNVNVGDVTIARNVDVAAVVGVVATVCGVQVGPLALAVVGQAVAVDRSGRSRTVCEAAGGPVQIVQN